LTLVEAKIRDGRSLKPRGTALHYAAFCGLHSIVDFLITAHSQDIHSRAFDDELTALHVAVIRGHAEVVQILLERGADPTVQDKDGQTPFHFASLKGDVEVIRMILEQGADPTVQDKHGRTPFHIASRTGTCGSRSDDSRAGRRSDSAGQARLDTIPLGVANRDMWKLFG
jgi:hypothetical protein